MTDNGLEGARPKLIVVGNRYSNGCVGTLFLHDDMAAPLPYLRKTMARKNGADALPRKNAEFTQLQPPGALHTLLHAISF